MLGMNSYFSEDPLNKIIADFSLNLIHGCFTEDSLKQISFCLAGGCFKRLIAKKSLEKPRDLDIFPCSEVDRQNLIEICKKMPCTKPFLPGEWNTKFWVLNYKNEEILIEIVNKRRLSSSF